MTQTVMYPAMVNSPATALSENINSSATTIGLVDASVLPAAPNLATIGDGDDAETILYGGKSGNDLTGISRGFQGAAKAWTAGTIIARNFTEYDYDALKSNVETHLADDATQAHLPKNVGLANVTNVKQMPIANGVLENYREKLVTLSGTSTAINLSLGNVFTHTLSGNTTYSITNAVSGQAHSFTLIITQTETVRTITFPASVKWQGGDIPDMSTANKTYVLTFMSVDGGTNWLGMFGGEF